MLPLSHGVSEKRTSLPTILSIFLMELDYLGESKDSNFIPFQKLVVFKTKMMSFLE